MLGGQFLGTIVPFDILFRFIDGSEERAHGLFKRALFDQEQFFDGFGIAEIASEAVAGFGSMADDTA